MRIGRSIRRRWMGILLVPLVFAGTPASALDKVVFGNPNPAGLNIGMAPFYYATELGFFKEEGIEVEYVNFNGGAVLDPQLANKSVDLGWQGPDTIVISNDIGKDPLPLRYFYNHLRRYVWEVVVPADSKVQTLKDLKGAKIGVNSLATTNITTTKSMLRDVGLDPDKDVSFLAVGMGAPAFRAMQTGQIDALNLFDTMHTLLEQTGFKLRRLELPSHYTMLFENSLLTHKDNLTDKKKQLVGFGRALAKATVGCYANLPACVRIAWKQDPKTKPANLDEETAMKGAIAILEIRGRSYWDFPNGRSGATGNWGRFSDEMWINRVRALAESGIIKSDKMDPKNFYSNELIADINNFDTAAVVKQAETLK